MSLRRWFGVSAYELATAVAGRLMDNGELVIHAKRVKPD
jgi:hypothetical protein